MVPEVLVAERGVEFHRDYVMTELGKPSGIATASSTDIEYACAAFGQQLKQPMVDVNRVDSFVTRCNVPCLRVGERRSFLIVVVGHSARLVVSTDQA